MKNTDRFITKPQEKIAISKLEGISILCENDLYDFACLLLRLYDAKDKNTNCKTRLTLHGLANKYSWLTEVNSDQIEDMLKEHGFLVGSTIEYDKDCHDVETITRMDDSE